MPLFFLIALASLLLLGAMAASILSAAVIVAYGLWNRARVGWRWRTLQTTAIVVGSLHAAAWVHAALGGTIGSFIWPWQAVPIAAAVLTYWLVTRVSNDVLLPLLTRSRIDWAWPKRLLEQLPLHVAGAGVAVALAEILSRRAWDVLPVAAVPLFLAWRVYRAQEYRLEHQACHREAIESMPQGMCLVDRSGCVTLWNDTLQRFLDCSAGRAVGRSLQGALSPGPTPRDWLQVPLPRELS